MKKTVLFERHIQLGAKMVPFAGFQMPVEYSGINVEHMAVREAAAVFDVSHMGEFWITGKSAFDLLTRICSNDVSRLETGKVQYTCLPNGQGGIVDDLLIYKFGDEKYLAVVNAGNIEKDWSWFVKNNSMDAALVNASSDFALLAVQGPKAAAILQKICDLNLASIASYSFAIGTVAGVKDVIVSNTGYTGAGGFELYVNTDKAVQVWDRILEIGKGEGLIPAGLGARDTLRLEMGFCLYGNDIDDTTSPLEAGLGWITSFVDHKDFIDRERLQNQKTAGIKRALKGFVLQERGIPRHGYEIVNANGELIGKVTSGTMSPVLKQGIGLGYISREYWKAGTEIFIRIRNKDLKALVTKPPFI